MNDEMEIGGANNTPHQGISRRDALLRLSIGIALAAVGSRVVADDPIDPCLPTRYPGRKPPTTTCPNPRNAYTPTAFDGLNGVKAYLNAGIGAIPVVGGILNGMLNLLWPSGDDTPAPLSADDIWGLIQDRVAKLIDEKIAAALSSAFSNFYNATLTLALKNMRISIEAYSREAHILATATDPGSASWQQAQNGLFSQIDITHNYFLTQMTAFEGQDLVTGKIETDSWQVLPLYTCAASLHLAFLQDILGHLKTFGILEDKARDYQGRWDDAMAKYTLYVASTLAAALGAFETAYQGKLKQYGLFNPTDANRFPGCTGTASSGGLNDLGGWPGKRNFNDINNEYTVLVRDFLAIWQSMEDPSRPLHPTRKPLLLTRELWYGPYCNPDFRDLGPLLDTEQYYYDKKRENYCIAVIGVSAPYPEAQNPPITEPDPDKPIAPLRDIRIDTLNFVRREEERTGPLYPGGPTWLVAPLVKWNFVNGYDLYRTGDDIALDPTAFHIHVDPHDSTSGGAVTEVILHQANFSSPNNYDVQTSSQTVLNLQWTAGSLLSALEFVQENGKHTVIGGGDGDYSNHLEINDYEIAASISVADHVLCNMWVPSYVKQLYRNVHAAPLQTPGSLMLSFCLKDPSLKPTAPVLAHLYVASPGGTSVADIAELGRHWQRSLGGALSDEETAQLALALVERVELDGLDAKRLAFWQRLSRASGDAS